MIYIKKFFQKTFKFFFQILFKIIYGQVKYNSNNLENSNIKIDRVNNDKIRTINNEFYHVYSILKGRVYNDTVQNVAIINKNQILDNISYQQNNGKLESSNKSIILKKGTPRIKKKLKSTLFILSQGASGNDNYFHWLFDILPKIKICSEIYNLNKIDYFYFTRLIEWQRKILEIYGLENIKILDANKFRHVEAEKIIAVQHPWYEKGYINPEAVKIPSWIIKWLKDTFMSKAESFDCSNKIFIDRKDDTKFKHCQIINDDEVFEFLKSKGFAKYKVGQLSFKKQIYLFNNAEVIIGPHGAAFANLAFCNPGTRVIEFKPFGHPTVVNKRISEINNLNYQLIESKDNKNDKGDIFVDLNILKKII
tara:strand:+ start:640 stop:1734 length:1095 start_codon:yes stop_codon:yes gene_type:complete